MPSLATQKSIDAASAQKEIKRLSASAATPSTSTALTTITNSQRRGTGPPVGVDGPAVLSSEPRPIERARYGTLPLKKAPDGTEREPIAEEGSTSSEAEEESGDEEDESDEDESSTDSESSIYTRFSDLTRKQWATVGMLAIANFCSTVAFSCIAPFFPGEAKQKGRKEVKYGKLELWEYCCRNEPGPNRRRIRCIRADHVCYCTDTGYF